MFPTNNAYMRLKIDIKQPNAISFMAIILCAGQNKKKKTTNQ